MKQRTEKAIEGLLLVLPCVLQTDDALNEQERAAAWRIFEKLLITYINKKHKKSGRRKNHG